MRLVTYATQDRGERAGILHGETIADAWDAIGEPDGPPSLRALIAAGRVEEAGEKARGHNIALGEVTLHAPIPDPEKIVCVGLNYHAHAEEAGLEPPPVPTFFAKYANALVGDGARVRLPAASRKVDYEAEVAFVIGRRCAEVSEGEALDYIAGFTLVNDLSARDLQFQTPQWMPGKVFDGSAPCGPALVTADEVDPEAIEVWLRRNGEEMQRASTQDLIFPIASLVSHLSSLMTLEPGDLVATGTPAGVGSVRKPRVWLEDGDELVVGSPQLGELRTTIAR